jgi:hypothetical protein
MVWAADTEAQQEAIVRAAWEKKLGHPLVTEAYWPGKTWYNIKAKAIVYDGSLQRGQDFYNTFIPEYFQILENMGLKTQISLTYEGSKSQVDLDNQNTYIKEYKAVVDQYARDDHYQLVTWYDDGNQFEGNQLGGGQLWYVLH